jgi:hypothetical protein
MNYVCLQGNAKKNHPLLRGVENPKFVDYCDLGELISTGLGVTDSLIVVNELPQTEPRQRGRPKNMPNGASSLDYRVAELTALFESGTKRGEIAKKMEVGRDTLNDFIAAKLPQFHRKKA